MKREIKQLTTEQVKRWVLEKHYAKRKPRIQYSYGLYIDSKLMGIITYGYPATPFVSRGLCGIEHEKEVLELNRLVINSNVPKNSASFLVANSMKLLPENYKIIVSYADTSVGHVGYIYQATNFLYLGLSYPMKEWRKKGSKLHSQNVCKELSLEERRKSPDYEQIQRPRKHRYVWIRGNKKEKQDLKSKLKYPIVPYPKGESKRYNSPDILESQKLLI